MSNKPSRAGGSADFLGESATPGSLWPETSGLLSSHARGEHRPTDDAERLFSCSRAVAKSFAPKE